MISVIIPAYNEEKDLSDCLKSLLNQKNTDFEIIAVDDGSTDKTVSVIKKLQEMHKELMLISQDHKGPGEARNQGAKIAKGEILVFVDSDMTFKDDFLDKLTRPIIKGQTKGTFTKEEFVRNWSNVWARCWNYNQGINNDRRIPANYPDKAPVFRAILKKEFEKVKGFAPIGYTDDWSLSRRLGYQAEVVNEAVCYHKNPENLKEVYEHARWIGKNEFITKKWRRLINLFFYFAPISLIKGVVKAIFYREADFIKFKMIYDQAVFISIVESFFKANLYN